ncbi:MAG: MgtC/SapB family protein [Bdellovibrionales bacterium]|jgi:putative Mg2+ transporter-C (MgtC) family protein
MIDLISGIVSEGQAYFHSSPDLILVSDMAVALALGFLFGYERSYHGRAAGMRTYGLVCMVSAVLVSVSVHPSFWLGGHWTGNMAFIDPSRTIQGIVTGIGFLGAGIIMKNGLNISGLTTAASIWASASIGVLVGLGLYVPAFVMTLLAELFVMMGMRFDLLLPSRRPISVMMQFQKGFRPSQNLVQTILRENGYDLAAGSIMIQFHNGQVEWHFVAISLSRRRHLKLAALADVLPDVDGLENFHLTRARN